MRNISLDKWKNFILPCVTFYNLEGIEGECELWFKMWNKVQEAPDMLEVLKKV